MQDEFRIYQELDIRNCNALTYSYGGHLLACVDGRLIKMYNAYTLELMHAILMENASESTKITKIMFAPGDYSLAVCGSDGYAGRWALPSYQCVCESIQDEDGLSSFDCLDYFPGEKDTHQIILSGAVKTTEETPMGTNQVKILRALGSDDVEKLALFDDNLDAIGRYTTVKHIQMDNSRSFVAGT